MPVQPDTRYTQTQPWSSINTPTGVYKQTPDQIQKMAHAVATARLDLSTEALRMYAPTNVIAVGLGRQPTIDDVLAQSAGNPPQMSIFDYSGGKSGIQASNAPNISIGPGSG